MPVSLCKGTVELAIQTIFASVGFKLLLLQLAVVIQCILTDIASVYLL